VSRVVPGLTGDAPLCTGPQPGRYDDADAQPGPVARAPRGRETGCIRAAGPRGLPRRAAPLRGTREVLASDRLARSRSPQGELIVFGDGRAIVRARVTPQPRGRSARDSFRRCLTLDARLYS
jgi:hypothetical protein